MHDHATPFLLVLRALPPTIPTATVTAAAAAANGAAAARAAAAPIIPITIIMITPNPTAPTTPRPLHHPLPFLPLPIPLPLLPLRPARFTPTLAPLIRVPTHEPLQVPIGVRIRLVLLDCLRGGRVEEGGQVGVGLPVISVCLLLVSLFVGTGVGVWEV